jgi:hypothetical protein
MTAMLLLPTTWLIHARYAPGGEPPRDLQHGAGQVQARRVATCGGLCGLITFDTW